MYKPFIDGKKLDRLVELEGNRRRIIQQSNRKEWFWLRSEMALRLVRFLILKVLLFPSLNDRFLGAFWQISAVQEYHKIHPS